MIGMSMADDGVFDVRRIETQLLHPVYYFIFD